jgi:hypothetical protein
MKKIGRNATDSLIIKDAKIYIIELVHILTGLITTNCIITKHRQISAKQIIKKSENLWH